MLSCFPRPGRKALVHPATLPLWFSLFLAGCESSSAPEPSDPHYVLVFEGYLADTPELLALDAGSGEVERLLAPGTEVRDPQPSPDGTRIAFVIADYAEAKADVYVMNRDGSGVTRLTFADELDDQPSWSPDGRRIAFRSYRTQREGDIWVMEADGDNPVNLTPDPLPGVPDERTPAWSPDGERIAYASNVGGTMDIWTMAADGSDKQRLTETPEYDTEPAWSPDGTTIVFRRNLAGRTDLHLVASGGGEAVPLALDGYQRMPVWDPDGEHLVFTNQPTLFDRPDLYRMGRDGEGLEPLVTGAVSGGSVNPTFMRLR